jgi:hypothetical protein
MAVLAVLDRHDQAAVGDPRRQHGGRAGLVGGQRVHQSDEPLGRGAFEGADRLDLVGTGGAQNDHADLTNRCLAWEPRSS